ncbi:mechanosensitive ion channel family protein [Flavobacterium sp. NRK F10]|uniref:Mechanosensing system component YbdG n=1 Tax=Flavobacterium sediminis TaxID=2201181 RepID=A0A2U8QYU4_9FLAO|nr:MULTISPECIES: mechanosensitive ion channel domain-containing protein [Flavobacterium]AWM15024.1 mechanosensitive ion channel protein MscS [Flavobacterium sediminis]MCO6176296.1 mechanosensitive ion channel family protein [Flavobacterium sp. NRK F10]
MKIFNWAENLLHEIGVNQAISVYLSLVINIVLLVVLAYVLDLIFKKILIVCLAIVAARTRSSFDDFLVANKTAKYIAHLVPLLFIYKTVPVILNDFTSWENFFEKGIKIYIILLTLWIIRSVFNALKDFLKEKPRFSDKPIDSYIQVVMILLWTFGIVSFLSILFEISKTAFLTTFGSISAVIILMFRDTILGFVASISVSANDMVRIGDWITMEKFGADGDVIEINLATVKVRNFDNTTTTIPTYSLISDSFRNWRGMTNSDGRRIKRQVLIKPSSVRFVKENELDYFKKIQHLTSYIEHRQSDIDKYNTNNTVDKSLIVNGRNLTNLGLFRKYVSQYILQHPGINKDMLMMVRYLEITERGIPLEVYCFSKDKNWVNYEHIMADLFDHIIASVRYFGLEILEISNVEITSKQ